MHTNQQRTGTQIDTQAQAVTLAQTYMNVNNSSFICFNKSSSSFRQKYVLLYIDGRLYININIQYIIYANTSCKSDLMFVKWKAFGLVWFGLTWAGLVWDVGCGVSVHGVIGDDVVFQIFGFHHIQVYLFRNTVQWLNGRCAAAAAAAVVNPFRLLRKFQTNQFWRRVNVGRTICNTTRHSLAKCWMCVCV